MVFALVSATQEFLNQMIDDLKKEKKQQLEREEEAKRLAEEERVGYFEISPLTQLHDFLILLEILNLAMIVFALLLKSSKFAPLISIVQ